MIADIESATPADRSRLFGDLRRLLAAHGAAEEEVIHPQARDNLNSHAAVVDDRLAEEAQAAKAIGKLEELDPSSADFVTEFDKFTQAVISHAEHEEHDEFPALRDTSDPAVIEQMMTTLQHVGQIAIGQDAMPDRENSFAAMLDRARAEVRSQKNRG